jgi:hypothetical protein
MKVIKSPQTFIIDPKQLGGGRGGGVVVIKILPEVTISPGGEDR